MIFKDQKSARQQHPFVFDPNQSALKKIYLHFGQFDQVLFKLPPMFFDFST